ncbi:MAG: hypothetical protein V7709_11025 [Halioglobus sp.]
MDGLRHTGDERDLAFSESAVKYAPHQQRYCHGRKVKDGARLPQHVDREGHCGDGGHNQQAEAVFLQDAFEGQTEAQEQDSQKL